MPEPIASQPSPRPEKRPRYFDGQYLKVEDFTDEQQYHLDRQRRPLQLLHVSGILEGLQVEPGSDFSVTVAPGSAIDAQGRQILLQSAALLQLSSNAPEQLITKDLGKDVSPFTIDLQTLKPTGASTYYLVIAYAEAKTDQQTEAGSEEFRRWHERPILQLIAAVAGTDLPLAKLTLSSSGIAIDPSIRRYSGVKFPSSEGQALSLRSQGGDQVTLQGNLSITGKTGIGTDNPQSQLSVSNGVAIGQLYASTYAAPDNSLIVEGSLGIGTTNPKDKLSIQGGALSFYHPSTPDTYVGLDYDIALDALCVRSNVDTNYINIQRTTGNIGIGNRSPQRKLQLLNDIAGLSVEVGSGTPNAGAIRFGDNSGWKLHFGRSRESTNAALNSSTAGVLMTIQDNGNVGIGTTTPTARLEIPGTNPGTLLSVGAASGSTADIALCGNVQLREFGGTGVAYIQAKDMTSNRNIGFQFITQSISSNVRNDREAMKIDAQGNVGIGTSQPNNKLEIVTDANNNGLTIREPNKTGSEEKSSVSLNLRNSNGFWHLSGPRSQESNNPLSIYWYNNSNFLGPYLTIKDNGNVSVDSLAVSSSLSFGNSTRQMITLYQPDYGIGVQSSTQYFRTGSNFAWYKGGSHSDAELNAGGGTTQMVIRDGKVGIGTNSPDSTALLDVAGVIKAKSYKTTLYSAGGLKSDKAFVNSIPAGQAVAGWYPFPSDPYRSDNLQQTISLSQKATVLAFYQISMVGGNQYLVTRLILSSSGGNATEVSRTVCGNTSYWNNSGLWIGELEAGNHTLSVQYRTTLPQGSNNPSSNDTDNRSLQVLILGSA